MMLCAGMAAQAQTIHLDHHFWDGYSLYTVKEIRMGKYFYMTTSQGEELTLEKVDGKPGEPLLSERRRHGYMGHDWQPELYGVHLHHQWQYYLPETKGCGIRG